MWPRQSRTMHTFPVATGRNNNNNISETRNTANDNDPRLSLNLSCDKSSVAFESKNFINTESSPMYTLPRFYHGRVWFICFLMKVPGPHLTVDRASSSQGSDSSEERRKRVTRHISIDDTPITHTYHQNSLESSSESSQSPSEVEL